MRYLLIYLLLPIAGMMLIFVMGPKPKYPKYNADLPQLNMQLNDLEAYVNKRESQFPEMLSENRSKIIWHNGVAQTEYSIVYLPGFSATPMEADPMHREFAKRYGCNIYLHRLAKHGIHNDLEIFADLTPKDMIDSAKEAIAIGRLLGKKVIVMSTSTGSTLSTYLAAENNGDIHSLIMYSPNFNLHDPNSRIAMFPWGNRLMQTIVGKYRSPNFPKEAAPYWNGRYRIEGLVALIYMVNETMTDDRFKKIDIPYFVGYWYKNDEECDKIISVKRIKEFEELTQTPDNQKRVVPFDKVDAHVICSPFMSKDLEGVTQATNDFAEQVLGLIPIE